MKNKVLEVLNLFKEYKSKNSITKVIDDINFSVYEGEFLGILGSSGCGKTTLFNIISNIEKEFSGQIVYNFDANNIGYMFQEPALFPWLTIEKNAMMTSRIKNVLDKDYIKKLLIKYNLYEFKDKYPDSISGGMKQRLSLIRTIASKPKLLLLDEPFAALDYQSRLAISSDVYKIVKENNITTILITHDISEAISLCDRVIILSKRPSKIKNIYNINLHEIIDPVERRKDIRFLDYYEKIGKDLDIFEI